MHALSEGRESSQGVLTGASPADRARPLAGLRVLVTRPGAQAGGLTRSLTEAGAVVAPIPTIAICPPADLRPIHDAVDRFETYDWVVLTSANGVERLAVFLERRSDGPSLLRRARIAAVGPATARALERLGATVTLVPGEYRGERLAEAMVGADPSIGSARVLLARAARGGATLPARLASTGARVDDVAVYETRVDRSSEGALRDVVGAGALDWITFTSASTAEAFAEMAGTDTGGARIAAIGPITAEAVERAGLPQPVVAPSATTAALVQAIVDEVST